MAAIPPARFALWAGGAVGVSFGARALLGSPPAWAPALVGLAGYLTFGTLGVFWPERGMYGRVLSRGPERPEVALTFDDGPSPHTTARVLDVLERYQALATFFVVGRKAQQHPELLREISRRGHALGLHGYDHDRLFSLRRPRQVVSDVERTRAAIEAAGPRALSAFRPPIGFASHFTIAGARAAGVTLVGCSGRALDGVGRANPHKVARRLLRAASPGAILALHDAAENEDHDPASIAALPALLEGLATRGLRTVTLEAWLARAAPRIP